MNFFIKQFQITKCNGALVYSLYSPDKRISDPDRFPSNLSTVPLSFILCVSSVGNKTQLWVHFSKHYITMMQNHITNNSFMKSFNFCNQTPVNMSHALII